MKRIFGQKKDKEPLPTLDEATGRMEARMDKYVFRERTC